MTAETRGLVWMYGVADGDLEPAGHGVAGVSGAAPRTITAAGLTAIVGDVAIREYGAPALQRNLEDLDWLARTARAHHAVLTAIARQGPVVPMRLATLFASDARVADTLRERSNDFRRALSVIHAHSEWGIKAYAVKPPEPSIDPAAQPAGSGAGAAYLQRRRAELTASKNARQEALASARAICARLSQLATSSRLYPAQAPDLAGQATPMVLNATYLVADSRTGEFAAAADSLAADHRSIEISMTGPWPAYSFTDDSEEPVPR